MRVVAIIVAAGKGVRMKAGGPKAFLRLRGLTLLERSLDAFLSHPRVDRVVAAVGDPAEAARMLGRAPERVVLVRGGETRQESVACALAAIEPVADEILVVHDAARPLVTRRIIDAVIVAAEQSGAAVPVIPPADTLKQMREDGTIAETLSRDLVRLAQTPQGFQGELLREAHARAAREGFRGTDDAALVERMGRRVTAVDGSPLNLKITTRLDLELAEAILGREKTHDDEGA